MPDHGIVANASRASSHSLFRAGGKVSSRIWNDSEFVGFSTITHSIINGVFLRYLCRLVPPTICKNNTNNLNCRCCGWIQGQNGAVRDTSHCVARKLFHRPGRIHWSGQHGSSSTTTFSVGPRKSIISCVRSAGKREVLLTSLQSLRC